MSSQNQEERVFVPAGMVTPERRPVVSSPPPVRRPVARQYDVEPLMNALYHIALEPYQDNFNDPPHIIRRRLDNQFDDVAD